MTDLFYWKTPVSFLLNQPSSLSRLTFWAPGHQCSWIKWRRVWASWWIFLTGVHLTNSLQRKCFVCSSSSRDSLACHLQSTALQSSPHKGRVLLSHTEGKLIFNAFSQACWFQPPCFPLPVFLEIDGVHTHWDFWEFLDVILVFSTAGLDSAFLNNKPLISYSSAFQIIKFCSCCPLCYLLVCFIKSPFVFILRELKEERKIHTCI